MKNAWLNRWIASGMPRDEFSDLLSASVDQPSLARQFAEVICKLNRQQLESMLGVLPALLNGSTIGESVVDSFDSLDLSGLDPINKLLIGELAAAIFLADEKWEKCIPRFDSLIELARSIDEKEELAIMLNDRGICFYRLARYPEARDSLDESLRVADELDSDKRRARARINLGLVYKELGQLEEAASHYKVAMKLARDVGDNRTLLSCYLNIGNIYKELARWGDGAKALQKGIDLAHEIGDQREEIRGRLNYGVLLLEKGDQKKAVGIFQKVIDEASSIQAEALVSIARTNLAYSLVKLGKPDESLKYSNVNLEESTRTGDVEGVWRAHANIARAMSQMDGIPEGESHFAAAIDAFDKLRGDLRSTRDRIEFQRNLKNLYSEFIEFSLKHLGPEAAFARLAQSKSRTLLESGWPDIAGSSNELKKPDIVLDEIRSALETRPGSVIIDYFTSADRLIIFTCDPDRINVKEVKIPAGRISEIIRELASDIGLYIASREYRDSNRATSVNPPEYLAELGEILLLPVMETLKRFRRLIFVPHGILHSIPFAAVVDWNRNYLIEDHEISILPSSEFIIRQKSSGKARADIVAFRGSDEGLTGAADEIRELKELFRDSLKIADIDPDSELSAISELRKAAKTARAIHFTGHAEFDHADPYSSALILESGRRLSAVQIIESDLDFSGVGLVTIAACETAVGEVKAGDEVVSLARAFLAKGSQSVLVSLWKVDDLSATELMAIFYREWRNGSSMSESLRTAEISMLEKSCPHPYFFAPFELMGV